MMNLDNCTSGFNDAVWAEGSAEDQLSAIFVDNLMLQMIGSEVKEKTFTPGDLDNTGTAITFKSILNRLLFMSNMTKEPAEIDRSGVIKVNIEGNRHSIALTVTAENTSFTLSL